MKEQKGYVPKFEAIDDFTKRWYGDTSGDYTHWLGLCNHIFIKRNTNQQHGQIKRREIKEIMTIYEWNL